MKKTTKKTTTKAPKKVAKKTKPSAAKRSGSKVKAITKAEHETLLQLMTRTVDALEGFSTRLKKVEEAVKHVDMLIAQLEVLQPHMKRLDKASLDAADIARGANQAVAQVMRAAGEQHTEITKLQGQVKELADVLNSLSENNAQIVDSILDTAQSHHERLETVERACRGLFPPTGPQETPEDDPPGVEAASPLDPVVTTAAEALGHVVGAAFTDMLTGGRSRR